MRQLTREAKSRVRAAEHRTTVAGPREANLRLDRARERWGPDEALDELRYVWGSWVCFWRATVNSPDAWVCKGYSHGEKCGGEFKESREWAPAKESLRAAYEAKRKRKEEKKEERRTLLDKALSFAKWECSRCRSASIVNRNKCYVCSQQRPKRARRDDDSLGTDSSRERRVAASLEGIPERRRRKTRGRNIGSARGRCAGVGGLTPTSPNGLRVLADVLRS